MFLAAFGDNVQAAAGAEYALEELRRHRLPAVGQGHRVHDPAGPSTSRRASPRPAAPSSLEDTYEDDATDFSAQIAKIKALPEQPAFYYIAAMPDNVGTVVKQMRDAGLTGPIVGGDGYDTPDLLADRRAGLRTTCSSPPTR